MLVPEHPLVRYALRLVLTAGLALGAFAAHATVITFEHNYEFSGGADPAGTPPWITATLDDGGTAGSVLLTLAATNLVDVEYIDSWYFNLDPNLDPTLLRFTLKESTGPAATISTGTDANKADGDGWYDILLDFPNSSSERFDPAEVVKYEITGIGTLTAASFNFLSTPGGGNGVYLSAAHINGINSTDSGWIAPVPEPSSLALFGVGLFAVLLTIPRGAGRLAPPRA